MRLVSFVIQLYFSHYNDKMLCVPTNSEVIDFQLWDNLKNENITREQHLVTIKI